MAKETEEASEPKSEQVAVNRKAKFKYDILEKFEAGLALTGTEVKSLREHKVSLSDAYAMFRGSELYLINLDIAPYDHAGYVQHDPKRARKLLLHRRELNKLVGKVSQRGLTLIPLGVHFNNRGWAKVRLGLARGRQMFDKRAAIREREQKRDIARQSRKYGAR